MSLGLQSLFSSLLHRAATSLAALSTTTATLNRKTTSKNIIVILKNQNMSSWTCKKCTFINSSSSSKKQTCEICLSASSPSLSQSSSSQQQQQGQSLSPNTPKWSCKACTFLNSYKNPSCQVCTTMAPVTLLSSFNDSIDDDSSLGVGSVFLPLQRCNNINSNKNKKNVDQDCVFVGVKAKRKVVDFADGFESGSAANEHKSRRLLDDSKSDGAIRSLKILSYNVWFREDLELYKRMKSLGDLILLNSPDLICFQEVTPNIYDIFRHSTWWKTYHCSVTDEKAISRPYFCMQLSRLPVKSFSCKPFHNSIMGRELCLAEVGVQGLGQLVLATSHLESPCPAPPKWDQMYSKERVEQAKEAINILKKYPNVIFCGDMNWDEKTDGDFPLLDGWVDAWTELRPGEVGWTYDTKSNQMLSGNRTLQKRLDRFVCNLHDFKISRLDMIGKEAIPGVSYCKEKKVKNEIKKLALPVLPSDHYGLLMTISAL